jgi:hypothetical protein
MEYPEELSYSQMKLKTRLVKIFPCGVVKLCMVKSLDGGKFG